MIELWRTLEQYVAQQIDLYGDCRVPTYASEAAVPDPDEQPMPIVAEASSLAALADAAAMCSRCTLAKTRHKVVFGSGDPGSSVMLIGEAPGADEDRVGEPFVGEAGALLSKMLAAIQLDRNSVYICNVLKCRPPNNRDPLPDEIIACKPFLLRQIELINPRIILCLGRFSAHVLLQTDEALSRLRGRVHYYHNAEIVVTYHPAALLRNPQYKRDAWEDLKLFRRRIDELMQS